MSILDAESWNFERKMFGSNSFFVGREPDVDTDSAYLRRKGIYDEDVGSKYSGCNLC